MRRGLKGVQRGHGVGEFVEGEPLNALADKKETSNHYELRRHRRVGSHP